MITVREDRHIVLSGSLVNFRALRSTVRHDNTLIGNAQLVKPLTNDLALRTPIDVIQLHREGLPVSVVMLSVSSTQGAMIASVMPWISFLSSGTTVARIPSKCTVSPTT